MPHSLSALVAVLFETYMRDAHARAGRRKKDKKKGTPYAGTHTHAPKKSATKKKSPGPPAPLERVILLENFVTQKITFVLTRVSYRIAFVTHVTSSCVPHDEHHKQHSYTARKFEKSLKKYLGLINDLKRANDTLLVL